MKKLRHLIEVMPIIGNIAADLNNKVNNSDPGQFDPKVLTKTLLRDVLYLIVAYILYNG